VRYVTLLSRDPDFFTDVVAGLRALPWARTQGEGSSWHVSFESGAFLNVDDQGQADPTDLVGLQWMTAPMQLDGAFACGLALGGAAEAELVAKVVNSLAERLSQPASVMDPEGQAWLVGQVDPTTLAP